jgi:hypothetical protein
MAWWYLGLLAAYFVIGCVLGYVPREHWRDGQASSNEADLWDARRFTPTGQARLARVKRYWLIGFLVLFAIGLITGQVHLGH